MNTERPRDILGRPLPVDTDPALVVPGVSARTDLSDTDAWALAMDYLARGMPFHAHEVFELRWRQSPEEHRAAWQALAQWGAALTHHARGNAVGARAVAKRAHALLESAEVPECVDVELVSASLRGLEAAE